MDNMINANDRIAYAEIDYIIHNMNQKYIDALPSKMLSFFKEAKDPSYNVKIDPKLPLYTQNLQDYTFDLLNILNLNYWCEDDDRKKEIIKLLSETNANDKLDMQMKSNFFTEIKNND